jgi:hypothetical protein
MGGWGCDRHEATPFLYKLQAWSISEVKCSPDAKFASDFQTCSLRYFTRDAIMINMTLTVH